MTLTTVTVQVMPVVAPAGPALRPLHWSMVTGTAWAGVGATASPASEKPAAITTMASRARHVRLGRAMVRAAAAAVDIGDTAFRQTCQAPTGQPGTKHTECSQTTTTGKVRLFATKVK